MPPLNSLPRTVKALCVGYPGSGKTGSLASLANAGYNIRIIDFDQNIDPLFEYVDEAHYPNVDIQPFFDQLVEMPFTVGYGKDVKQITKLVPKGKPSSYSDALKLMDDWPDAGPISTWGPNDVLVLDSLTSMGKACMRRTLWMHNRMSKGARQSDWGEAQNQQLAMLEILKSKAVSCHVLVMAHLKIIESKFIEDLTDDSTDGDLTEVLKKAMEKSVSMIPPKLFPSALGRALPQEIGGVFPYILRYQTKIMGKTSKRVISLDPSEECDVKAPISLKGELPIETGLLSIFQSLEKD